MSGHYLSQVLSLFDNKIGCQMSIIVDLATAKYEAMLKKPSKIYLFI